MSVVSAAHSPELVRPEVPTARVGSALRVGRSRSSTTDEIATGRTTAAVAPITCPLPHRSGLDVAAEARGLDTRFDAAFVSPDGRRTGPRVGQSCRRRRRDGTRRR